MSTPPVPSPGNVVLEGHIDVPAERVAAVVEALPQHIALSRAESGCRHFDVVPDPQVKGRFNVYEVFEERSAFESHQLRMADSRWGQVTRGIVRHYSVTHVSK